LKRSLRTNNANGDHSIKIFQPVVALQISDVEATLTSLYT